MSLASTSELLKRSLDQFEGRVLLINPPADDLGLHILSAGRVEKLQLFSQFFADHRVHQRLIAEGLETGFGVSPKPGQTFDRVVVFLAREKARTSLLMQLAASQVSSGASIWLVGENRAGIKSAGRLLAEVADNVGKLDSARHCVLLGATNKRQESFELSTFRNRCQVDTPGGAMTVVSYPGVFSHGELDPATRLLLEHLRPRKELLDFGCGSGVIAGWAGRTLKGIRVVAADSDALALAATTETLAETGVDGQVAACDGFHGIEGRFAQIISNPPFHRGVRTDYRVTEEFIRRLPEHLTPNGELLMVANTFLDYPERIRTSLGHCEVVVEDRRFRVYRGSNDCP